MESSSVSLASSSKSLSSSLLNMKFMRRKEEAQLREKLRKEETNALSEARWSVKSLDRIICITDEQRFDLSPPIGRRSFRGK